MTEIDQASIENIVRETIRQLKKGGLLKDAKDIAYHEITARLRQFYKDGETDQEITDALRKVEEDPYYKILPLYFRYGYTIEAIAETFDVEVSTISRNKKRLSLKIHEILE